MGSVFIVGGTGRIGRACAARLLAGGWAVTVASRRDVPDELRAAGVAHVRLDRNEGGALARALGSGVDLLIDCIAYDATHADQLLAVQGSVGALGAISSAGVYRDAAGRSLGSAARTGFPELPVPVREDQPTVDPGPDDYASRKVAMEHRLLGRASVSTTILRPCAIYGPHSTAPREWFFVKRLLDGRDRVPVAFGARSRFHTSSVDNIAALVEAAARCRQAGSRILNAADPEAPTVAEIASAIANAMGRELEIIALDDHQPRGHGRTPWSVPAPFVLSDEAARAIGYEPVGTYAELVTPTVEWLCAVAGSRDWRELFPGLAAYPFELFDYEAEDTIIAAFRSERRPALH